MEADIKPIMSEFLSNKVIAKKHLTRNKYPSIL